jgi:hypothetical protein
MQEGAKEYTPDEAMQAQLGRDSREKYWSELTVEEKVERLRQMLKGLADSTSRDHEKLYFLSDLFDIHEHNQRGETAVPSKKIYAGHQYPIGGKIQAKGGNPDDVYF